MVSSFSNLGFLPLHAHLTHFPAMDARLSAAFDSLEALMRAAIREAMNSALTAIHKVVNPVLAELRSDLAQLRRDLALGVEEDPDPASMCSVEATLIEVGHQQLQNGDSNLLRISSTIHDHSIMPLLLLSPMLRALASSPVKSQLKESVAATIPLQHFEKPMLIAMVTTVPFPFSAIVGKTAALSQLADQDANVTTHIEGFKDHKSFKLKILCLCMLHQRIRTPRIVHEIFQQPGSCHKLNDPCDNTSYQRVVFNQRNNTKWLMQKPCILSFKVVEENGQRKGFGFVTSIIRLLNESTNLKGLKGGHFRQEHDMFAILRCT